ncbi:hypothetical protein [Inquilinus sp.]|jgi:hypothetical protein|uniref:hypothetical protein n=1 Tax=Inquilinus sp. TaxID=1932117 RepID=UPI003784276C
MGWLYMQSFKGHANPQAYLDNQLTWNRPDERQAVLRSAIAVDRNYYAAVEHLDVSAGQRRVFAVVCLVYYNPRAGDGFIFGYKDQTECMGPYQVECPIDILDLLTPTASEWANAWRAKCRELAAAQAAAGSRPV